MANLTVKDVNVAIMHQDWTFDQLISMTQAVKFARAQLGKKILRNLRRGQTVEFTDHRNGLTHTGTVTDVKIKKAIVRVGMTNWNVPGEMLIKVAA
jgi:hypothetical protein